MPSIRQTLAASVLLVLPHTAQAVPVVFTAAGPDAASIQDEVDAFRAALGALNPFVPQNFSGGRRQINWDAAPDTISDPNPFPGDFFNFNADPRARGIEFRPSTNPDAGQPEDIATGFQLSSTEDSGVPVRFGLDTLNVFSEERLFAPTGGTIFDVVFFDPADQVTQAKTQGLGIVFTNVSDLSGLTNGTIPSDAAVSFFTEGQNIATDQPSLIEFAPASGPGGLSFLGVLFDEPQLIGATVLAGFNPIDTALTGDGVVALDDFIFGEPTPVPLPPAALLLLTALAGSGLVLRRRAG
ncbi:MAG: hypothetical protein AAGI34_07885 [Pseudomonadota bacterium]